MREVFKLIGKVATSDAAVLITGESEQARVLLHRPSRTQPQGRLPWRPWTAGHPRGASGKRVFGHDAAPSQALFSPTGSG